MSNNQAQVAKPEASEPKKKRELHRSPNYPAMSLDDAIDKVRAIYAQERKAKTSTQVIYKHLGFEKATGSAARAISSLRQYGLLDGNSGSYGISDSAFQILHLPDADPKKTDLIRTAGRKPALFSELLARYGAELPSDDTIRSFLITSKSFNPASVADFVRAFRKTVAFAKLTSSASQVDDPEGEDGDLDTTFETGAEALGATPPIKAKAKPTERVYGWPLSIPRSVRADLRLTGDELRAEDIERLKRQLDLLIEAISDEVAEKK